MKKRSLPATFIMLSVLAALAACQKEADPAPAPQPGQQAAVQEPQQPAPAQTPPPAEQPAPAPGLVKESTPAPAVEAIQTKQVGEGTLALTKAKVVGQILNVEFVFTPHKGPDGKYKFAGYQGDLKDFDYIDESTSKKVGLLQDENGKYSADPVGSSGASLNATKSHPVTISLKFPAPPETSPTITLDVPNAGSFDSVPVSR